MDLVDEEDITLVDAREDRGQVAGVLDRRTARDAKRCRHLVGDDHRDRRLAESGRAGEEHVVGRPVAGLGGVEHQGELLAHALLADQLLERFGTQGCFEGALLRTGVGDESLELEVCVVIHAQALDNVRRASRSSAEMSGLAPAGRSPATVSTALSASRLDQPRPRRAS